MAIAFTHVSIHTRSQGHSSVAGSAYRTGELRVDNRTGEVHDYRNRAGVQHTEILLPPDSPALFYHGEVLWNAVEAMEKRKDAQVAKDVVLALPKELSLADNIQLTREFANTHFVSKGLPVEFAIHDHGDGNPHAHLYITTRRLYSHGFDTHKARDLNPNFANSKNGKGFVSEKDYWGEQWRVFQNEYFAAHGFECVVDENHLVPMQHEGRIQSRDETHHIKYKNQLQQDVIREMALNNPDKLLELISKRYAVFTERQMASIVFKATQSAEEFQTAFVKLKAHPDIICLGLGNNQQLHYTTRQTVQQEITMIERAEKMAAQTHHALSSSKVDKALRHTEVKLTQEQISAVRAITTGGDMAIVVGRAGTGKSFMLKTANQLWQEAGFSVHGISVSGIAAKNLQVSSDIPSSTIARFKARLEHGKLELNSKSIVVMDEAGMTNLADMAYLIENVQKANAKLILVGDPEQLQPIGAGAPLRALCERIHFIAIETIQRQQNPDDRKASQALAEGKVTTALNHYEKAGGLHWDEDSESSFEQLAKNYLKTVSASSNTLFSAIALAFTNADVDKLNETLREQLINSNKINAASVTLTIEKTTPHELGWGVTIQREQKSFAVGDKILFRKNDKHLDVVNGEFAVITALSSDASSITVKFENERSLTYNSQQYREFDYGYAATVHKAQGLTIDNAHVYICGKQWDSHLAYVALTRHRQTLQLYTDKNHFRNQDELSKTLSRKAAPDSVLHWPEAFAKHRGFDTENVLKRFFYHVTKQLGELTKKIGLKTEFKTPYTSNSTHIDWLHSKYAHEWKSLQNHPDTTIQWMVKYVKLGETKQTASEKQSIDVAITELAQKLSSKPEIIKALRADTPHLSSAIQKIQMQYKAVQKNRGVEKNGD